MSASGFTCYMNGQYLPLEEASIHPHDLGLLRGYGVFDFIQSKFGKPFRLKDHYDRLVNSAGMLDLTVPVDYPQFKEIIDKLVEIHGRDAYTIRALLTGGVSPDSLTIGSPNFLVLFENDLVFPGKLYEEGAKVVTMQYRRDMHKAKTIHYTPSVRLRNQLKDQNVTEVLFVDKEQVLEASTSNFMVFLDGKLVTTKDGILEGITRKVVLEAAEGNFPVELRSLTLDEVKAASGAFICSTSKDVMPVTRIDDWQVGDGSVCPDTRKMMAIFEEYARTHS